MPTLTNITALSGTVPDTVYDDTNRCLVLDLFWLLQESQDILLYNTLCVTDHELLEKVARIVNKRVNPVGLIDHNTGLKIGD